MKKIIITSTIIIILLLIGWYKYNNRGFIYPPVYQPIPASQKEAYKKDVEKLFASELPKTEKQLDSIVNDYKDSADKLIAEKNLTATNEKYIELDENSYLGICRKPEYELYKKIMTATNQYLSKPVKDYDYMEIYIFDYLRDNGISTDYASEILNRVSACYNKTDEQIKRIQHSFDYKLPPEYKVEIEETIKTELPAAKNKIDKYYAQAVKLNEKAISAQNKKDYIDKLDEYLLLIDSPEYDLYSKLIDITKKYTYISQGQLGSDWSEALSDVLYPYLTANNVELDSIQELDNYNNEKMAQIRQMLDDLVDINVPEEDEEEGTNSSLPQE